MKYIFEVKYTCNYKALKNLFVLYHFHWQNNDVENSYISKHFSLILVEHTHTIHIHTKTYGVNTLLEILKEKKYFLVQESSIRDKITNHELSNLIT